jgi:hypothetical protein
VGTGILLVGFTLSAAGTGIFLAGLTPSARGPDEDSTKIDPGVRTPSCSAASTISSAALSLIDLAKLKPSHFRNSERPNVGSRST